MEKVKEDCFDRVEESPMGRPGGKMGSTNAVCRGIDEGKIRDQINSVILSGVCLARSARHTESKDPGAAGSRSKCYKAFSQYLSTGRTPRDGNACKNGKGVLRLREYSASRNIHCAQDDRFEVLKMTGFEVLKKLRQRRGHRLRLFVWSPGAPGSRSLFGRGCFPPCGTT
jgi:hypothetical protein